MMSAPPPHQRLPDEQRHAQRHSRPYVALVRLAALCFLVATTSACMPRYDELAQMSEVPEFEQAAGRSGLILERFDEGGERLGKWRVRRSGLTIYDAEGVTSARIVRRDNAWVAVSRAAEQLCEMRISSERLASVECVEGPLWELSLDDSGDWSISYDRQLRAQIELDERGAGVLRLASGRVSAGNPISAEQIADREWALQRSRPSRLSRWVGSRLEAPQLLCAECILGPCATPREEHPQEVAALLFIAARQLSAGQP